MAIPYKTIIKWEPDPNSVKWTLKELDEQNNCTHIFAEVTQESNGKYRWYVYEPSPGGRVGTGVEDYKDWAKKAAESCMGKICRY